MTGTVLVLGAGGSAGWNFATAAGRAGWRVIGADIDPHALALAPTADRLLVLPAAERGADEIRWIVEQHGVDVVHAQPDPEVAWLSQHRHDLGGRVLLPSEDALEIAADKLATAQTLGRELCPRSYNVSVGALDDALHGQAWMRLRRGAGSMGALRVRSNAMMEAWLAYWHAERGVTADEWMIAEILPGRDLSWTGVYLDGELLGSACKERVVPMGASRHPANVSSTASVQTIVSRRDVNERCERAVQLLDPEPNGVYMLDLRENVDGVPLITEVNAGRFGTTSLFWQDAALDGSLTGVYLDAAVGSDPALLGPDCCVEGATWVRQPDAGCRLLAGAPNREVAA